MSDTLKIANSIWPNGMKVDSDGYAVFYPLGTKKVEVPENSSAWPKGNKLISPFVYQDDKLVGFCDTKAMEKGNVTTIVMPYEHIEAEFSSINKDSIQIATPKATFKKVSWKNSGIEDIPEAQYKFKGCKTVNDIETVNSNYKTTDIVDGTWTELLCDLEDARITFDDLSYHTDGMFSYTSLAAISSDLCCLTNGGGMFKGTNISSFDVSLPSLTHGREMFRGCSNLSSFNVPSLCNLVDGSHMFEGCSNLSVFHLDLSSLTNGTDMFSSCDKLTTFDSDLSSLTDGNYMFYGCRNLTTFDSDLSSLTDGNYMFYCCENLESFSGELSSLTNGTDMFYCCENLESFSGELSSLTNGTDMFSSCDKLTTFDSDLSSLTDGYWMFCHCYSLTTFTSNLSSLTDGYLMFHNCKLDTASVQNIADTINTVSTGRIHISIGKSEPNEQEKAAFDKMVSKGWTVYVNGTSDSNIYTPATASLDETGETQTSPIPFWAKPVQTDEEHAKYVDEQGNFFNILGGQFIYGDDLSTYGIFTCEDDAAANMRLTPYIKPIEN